MTGFATLAMINLDSADPARHAEFYHEVLGWEITHSEHEYAMVSNGTTSIGFGRMEGYRGPGWPADDKRYHLDVYVDDLADAVERSRKAGAEVPEFQPGGDRYTVVLDPGGQPLCLCLKS